MQFSDFTVLMAVYNGDDAGLFQKAMESVYANSIKPKKFVLVADGPLNKKLMFVIQSFSNNKSLHIIRLSKNQGLANALNNGLNVIDTEYTIRADADDINHPDRFKILIKKLEEGFDLVGSAIKEVDKLGRFLSYRYVPLSENQIKIYAKKRCPFNHMTVGFRTGVVKNCGGYPSIYLKEDYGLWATIIAKQYKFININKILVDATTGDSMIQRRGGFKYALSEFKLQRYFVKIGFKFLISAIADGLIRGLFFLLPANIRKFFYLKFLR